MPDDLRPNSDAPPSSPATDEADLPKPPAPAAGSSLASAAVRRRPGVVVCRALREGVRLVVGGAKLYVNARAFDHAASISFFALLSLAPLVVLTVSAAGYLAMVLGPEAAQVDWLAGQVTEALRSFTPVEGDKVHAVVAALVERRVSFGIIGAAVLLLGASMVFGAFEHALADIFGLTRRRKFLVSRALFSALLVASGVAVFALHHAMTLADSLLLAWRGATLGEILRESAALDALLTYLPVPAGFLAAVYLPGLLRIRPTAALAGAAVFFVLWEVAREAYAFYVTRIASFGVLYGSVAAPLLVILWTFYSANIFLYAVSVTATVQARRNNPLASEGPQE